jgi:hypothetical protein
MEQGRDSSMALGFGVGKGLICRGGNAGMCGNCNWESSTFVSLPGTSASAFCWPLLTASVFR